ncbi:MAG: glycoside hydrolase family 2 TIM barrel-domain containing protein [Thermoguttaceae bacterium]|nr:glycoside hydrolase family 2 TIM barrel-domain containing protein [Thermoguttaceae bacterium]
MRLIRTWCKQVFIGTIMALLAVFFCVATSAKAEQDGVKQSHWGVPSSPAVVNPVVQWSGTKILSLNGDWDFMTTTPWRVRLGLGDPGWGNRLVDWSSARKITVPGLWETQGVGEAGPGLAWDCEWDRGFWDLKHVYMGTAAYRKLIDIPADWGGGQIWLKVGGVRSEASIWVNGKRAAYVKNYCATEKFNITPFVKAGEKAVIIAMVRNDSPSRKGLYSANHRFGGFYRDVELELTPNIRLDNVWIKGNFDKREAQVEFLVRSSNDTEHKPVSAAFVVKTPDGKIVGKTGMANIKPVSDSVSAPLPVVLHCGINPCRFWSPEEPNLYIAQLELYDASGKIVHGQVERFGVRKLEVIGDKFYLNGKPYFLRGSGDHNYDCNSIIEPPNRLRFLEHMKIYKAAGFNFMRHHTHCPLPEYFEAADEAGILLMPELPYYHDVPTEAFGFDPVSDAKELFLNYRRYVSFAVYSGGNEGHLGSPVDEQLYQWVKKNDPQRLVVHQDGGRNLASNSDFSNGPISPWETCKQDELDRPFVAHEYLNLAIKMDPRQEPRFTGARVSPVSMEKYKALLKQTGLNETWGAACIAAAERLQAIYQKQGLESARLDPACDGYSFWSIVDASIPQGETVAA